MRAVARLPLCHSMREDTSSGGSISEDDARTLAMGIVQAVNAQVDEDKHAGRRGA